jgi:hypothetical protein
MYNDFYRIKNLNKQNFEQNLLNHLSPLTIKLKNSKSLFNMYDRSMDDIFYSKEFEGRGVDDSFRVWEVKIPRIRFKPGYQKL